MVYLPRVIDGELDRLTKGLAAVAVEGPKGVGKTESARRRAHEVLRMDRAADRDLLRAQESLTGLSVSGPLLIDEWQRHPASWDLVRRAVDDGAAPGSYLLTGSATPARAAIHSGAGRIVSLRMRPLAIAERALAEPTVGVTELLTGERPPVRGRSPVTLSQYLDEVVASGFPGIRSLPPALRSAQLDAYVDRIVQREFAEQGAPVRRPATLRAWLAAYAAATSTTASYAAILDAVTAGQSTKPAKTTTIAYRDVLSRLWLLEPVDGWLPTGRPLSRLVQAPKHHLADPALAAAILGLDSLALQRDGMLAGHFFESLVTMSVRTYAEAAGARVHHLRTMGGEHEIDLVVERRDRRVLAIEVKLAQVPDDDDVRHLRWLRSRLGDDVLDTVVVTTGPHAYRRDDGIAVVPAGLLGP